MLYKFEYCVKVVLFRQSNIKGETNTFYRHAKWDIWSCNFDDYKLHLIKTLNPKTEFFFLWFSYI